MSFFVLTKQDEMHHYRKTDFRRLQTIVVRRVYRKSFYD